LRRNIIFEVMKAVCIIIITNQQAFIYSILQKSLLLLQARIAFIQTSADTLHFDTVFTTPALLHNRFKIFNPNNQKLRINNITTGRRHESAFKLNVDGTAGTTFTNIDIAANDSIYIFTTVTIDPANTQLPFIVQDSISISYKQTIRKYNWTPFGQNAHFIAWRRYT